MALGRRARSRAAEWRATNGTTTTSPRRTGVRQYPRQLSGVPANAAGGPLKALLEVEGDAHDPAAHDPTRRGARRLGSGSGENAAQPATCRVRVPRSGAGGAAVAARVRSGRRGGAHRADDADLRVHAATDWLQYGVGWPIAVARIVRLIRTLSIDVVHSNSLHSWYGWAAAAITRAPARLARPRDRRAVRDARCASSRSSPGASQSR